MMNRNAILTLIPHQGDSCLLHDMTAHTAQDIHCRATSHLHADNPLRHHGVLPAHCGAEYGMQAAALHGALSEGGRKGGYLAALRHVRCHTDRLDKPDYGMLHVHAALATADSNGMVYDFRLMSEQGDLLLEGRGIVMHPKDHTA